MRPEIYLPIVAVAICILVVWASVATVRWRENASALEKSKDAQRANGMGLDDQGAAFVRFDRCVLRETLATSWRLDQSTYAEWLACWGVARETGVHEGVPRRVYNVRGPLRAVLEAAYPGVELADDPEDDKESIERPHVEASPTLPRGTPIPHATLFRAHLAKRLLAGTTYDAENPEVRTFGVGGPLELSRDPLEAARQVLSSLALFVTEPTDLAHLASRVVEAVGVPEPTCRRAARLTGAAYEGVCEDGRILDAFMEEDAYVPFAKRSGNKPFAKRLKAETDARPNICTADDSSKSAQDSLTFNVPKLA